MIFAFAIGLFVNTAFTITGASSWIRQQASRIKWVCPKSELLFGNLYVVYVYETPFSSGLRRFRRQ